jgi:hypothetical protein
MHKTARLALAAVAASLLLATALGTASARTLSTSSQNYRATWTSLEFSATETAIRCPATIEGSFHARTIAKVANALVGTLVRAVIKQESCTGGLIAAFNGVERYNGTTTPSIVLHEVVASFSGTLPNITARTDALTRFRFGISVSGVCTGQYGTPEDAVDFNANREAGGGLTTFTFVEGSNNATLFRRDGGFLCPISGRIKGTGSVTVQNSAARLTITLI